jgi:predicted 3-demethylubiquinone-9 3-methyltransferase (glyoxalase superfamily)
MLTPCLWYDGNAEEAAKHYVSIFKNSKITHTSYYSDAGPMPKGKVMLVEFELDGQPFTALNGGPHYKFTEAVSFMIPCANQAEVDHYWSRLGEGGMEQPCGWLKDKFGLSWQVVPKRLLELMTGSEPARAKRVAEAMFKMKKLDIATLEAAAG